MRMCVATAGARLRGDETCAVDLSFLNRACIPGALFDQNVCNAVNFLQFQTLRLHGFSSSVFHTPFVALAHTLLCNR